MKMQKDTESYQTSVPVLQEMRVELLRECPLLCTHCSAYAAPHHTMRLPFQRVLTLIDEFADGGGQRVTFTGGEPLMYPELEVVLQRANDRKLGIRLFSSGIVFEGSHRIAGTALLKRCAMLLDTVMYSVYSVQTEAHDLITRIPGSLALTLEAIKQTVALGIEAELHFVPTHFNYRDLPAVVELATSLAISKVGILRFVPHGRGKSNAESLALDKEEHLWLRKCILELRSRYPQLKIYVGSAYNVLGIDAPLPCTAAISQLVIEANGNIVPCSAFSNVRVNDTYGNVLQRPLQVIWQRSFYLQRVRQVLSTAHDCVGCLAQKTVAAGRIEAQSRDPLEETLM